LSGIGRTYKFLFGKYSMVFATYIKYGIKLTHVWFAECTSDLNRVCALCNAQTTKTDIIFAHGCKFISLNTWYEIEKQNSLIKDLKCNEDDLFLSLGKHIRSYIKRAEREGITVEIIDSKEIVQNPIILNVCQQLYEKMFHDKGYPQQFNLSLAKEYATENILIIGFAKYRGRIIGFDAIIHDAQNARLWLAAFDFRGDNINSQIFSRGHQLLDWKLIVYCHRIGISLFDFGGISSFDKPNGIDQFKMQFEKNNKVAYSNFLIPCSMKGKMLLFLYRMKKLVKR